MQVVARTAVACLVCPWALLEELPGGPCNVAAPAVISRRFALPASPFSHYSGCTRCDGSRQGQTGVEH